MTALGLFTAVGLVLGLVLARIAARGRRIRLARELVSAEDNVAAFGRILAVLRAYPFGEGVPQVQQAIQDAEARQRTFRAHAAYCRKTLGLDRVRA